MQWDQLTYSICAVSFEAVHVTCNHCLLCIENRVSLSAANHILYK